MAITPTRRGANGVPYFRCAAWTTPSDAIFFEALETVEVQIVGTPSAPYVPQRSLDDTNFVAANAYDKDGAIVASITTAGIYSIEGGCYVKLTGGGTGATVNYRAGA